MRTIERDRFSHWQELDSTEEILQLAATPPKDFLNDSRPSHAQSQARTEFTKTESMADALKLAREGWSDAPDLRQFAAAITTKSEEGTAQGMEHAVTGAFVDVSRYLEGHPENMMEFTETPAPRSVRIAINLWNSSATGKEIFEYRGAIAIALADSLSRAGMNVEIIAVNLHANESRTVYGCTTFPVKRAHEPLDIAAIAFWICHPAALRRLCFGAMDHFSKQNRTIFKTGPRREIAYGYSANIGDGLDTTIPGIDFLINCHAYDEAEAIEYLNKYAALLNH